MIQMTILMCVLLAGSSAELSGTVVDQQGQPIEGAIVVISTAKPRVGPATTCPSCYRDCAKRAYTDTDGRFAFDGLSSNLLFSLAAGGSGYQGSVSEHFDPARRPPIELRLEPLSDAPGVKQATGIVVDQDGEPVTGAEIRSRTIYRISGMIGGSDSSVTPLTLTDAEGKFQITTGDDTRALDLRVTASGYAPTEFQWHRVIDKPLRVELGRGASIRGRLLFQDSPLAAVELGLVQKDRTLGNIVTPAEVSTDEDGYFQFDQLPPDMDYTLYTHTGQDARGVLPVSLIQAPGHGMRADLGDIATQTPYRLTITVQTEDGSLLPAQSSVYVGRADAWRGSQLDLAQAPSADVRLNDVSRAAFGISLRVRGYEVVKTVPQLTMDLNRRYTVRVDADTDVNFVMRKIGGAAPKPDLAAVTGAAGAVLH